MMALGSCAFIDLHQMYTSWARPGQLGREEMGVGGEVGVGVG